MIAKIKKGYLVSVVLLIISVLIWSDLSFLFIGFAIVIFGITLLISINKPKKQ